MQCIVLGIGCGSRCSSRWGMGYGSGCGMCLWCSRTLHYCNVLGIPLMGVSVGVSGGVAVGVTMGAVQCQVIVLIANKTIGGKIW